MFDNSTQEDVSDTASQVEESILDDESLYEESPVDGFFGQRSHPQTRFVENSSASTETATKVLEVTEQQCSDSQEVSSSQCRPQNMTGAPLWSEQTPILDAGVPPPDYASATADWSSSRSSFRRPESGTPEPTSPANMPYDYESIEQTPHESRTQRDDSQPAWPIGNRGNPFDTSNLGGQWPFGSRGNPFSADNMGRQWPFGSRGSPFSAENMGGQWPFRGRLNPFGSTNSSDDPSPIANQDRQRHDDTSQHTRTHDMQRADPFTHRRHPESMQFSSTQIPGEVDEHTGLLARQRRSSREGHKFWKRRCCRPMSIFNWLLTVAVIVLIVLLATSKLGTNKSPANGHKDSSKDEGDHDSNDSGDDHKPLPVEPQDPEMRHPNTSQCFFDSFTRTATFDFSDVEDFFFIELLEHANYLSGGISGVVRVVPMSEQGKDVDIRIRVSFATTESWQVTGLEFTKTGDGLLLKMPSMERSSMEISDRLACLDLYVQIEVRSALTLGSWEIATGNLDVLVEENLFSVNPYESTIPQFLITNSSRLQAVRGSIDARYWSSRDTEIDVESGSVTGKFALRDSLRIRTHSGSVSIDVDPRREDADYPKPAEFSAISNSGTVDARFPTQGNIPARIYRSRAESASGTVSGKYILGQQTSFLTSSGTVSTELLPYYDSSDTSKLTAETRSGSIGIQVLEPYNDPKTPWKHSVHKISSTSGSVSLLYQDWVGIFEGRTISGSFELRGKDFRIISHKPDAPWEHIVASRGTNGGKVDVKTSSGSISMKVGQEYT